MSTHAITLKPIDKWGHLDFTRHPVYFHSSQIKCIYPHNKCYVVVDLFHHYHYFNMKYWSLYIDCVDEKDLHV